MAERVQAHVAVDGKVEIEYQQALESLGGIGRMTTVEEIVRAMCSGGRYYPLRSVEFPPAPEVLQYRGRRYVLES